MKTLIVILICLSTGHLVFGQAAEKPVKRWNAAKAKAWYQKQPWLVGCNFTPSSAINQLEMWQADTFDAETIERELKWAAGLGMNTLRVYLHDLAWEADAEGFKQRIDRFLAIASRHKIRPMLVLFDDCWNDNPKIGRQPQPKPGIHNSGWLQSPGTAAVNDPAQWPRLERYVCDIIGTFAKDQRILIWDLYNEPGNSGQGTKSLPLLKKTFEWARSVQPTQPLTVAVWGNLEDRPLLHALMVEQSDIISFHHYQNAKSLSQKIEALRVHGRPLLCSEWLARGKGSEVEEALPYFKSEGIGCYNWGLVSGKTQTNFPWGSKAGAAEPNRWHHDLLRLDGSPHDAQEAALFRRLTAQP